MASAVIVFWLVILFAIASSATLIREGQRAVVMRLGRPLKVLGPGLHLVVPFVDRVVQRLRIDEQALELQPQTLISRDNQTLHFALRLAYRIHDPEKATYAVADYLVALGELSRTTLRSVVEERDHAEARTQLATLENEVKQRLSRTAQAWGIGIERVELSLGDNFAEVSAAPRGSLSEAAAERFRRERAGRKGR